MCPVPTKDIMALHREKAANGLEVKKILLVFLQALLSEEVSMHVSMYQEGTETLFNFASVIFGT